MKNETEIYELYFKKIRAYVTFDLMAYYHQISVLEEILGIDNDKTAELIKKERTFLEQENQGIRSYKKDTVTLDYSCIEQRKSLINAFSKKQNGNYKQITTEYLESDDLNKGILLVYKPVEAEPAVLTHSIL